MFVFQQRSTAGWRKIAILGLLNSRWGIPRIGLTVAKKNIRRVRMNAAD